MTCAAWPGQSHRYSRAVRYIERCRPLAALIDHWGTIPAANAYVIDLRRASDHRIGLTPRQHQRLLSSTISG